ncbi:hypothetical protein [Anditalea andensis]|uniref:Uncharacterized protein n=1 Tax=Anditalea andensis TaxID=1048983 RepID=A0A074KZ41_9BACT|nr:hypothetical protein [Anditalea andensis]KEO75241.1 hypothetical protein EL17_06180 [Anditalea andensis]
METYFKTFAKKYTCKSKQDCHRILYESFKGFAKLDVWKTCLIRVSTNAMADSVDFSVESPGSQVFFGSRFFQLLFAAHYIFENFDPGTVAAPEWEDLIDPIALELNPCLLERLAFLPSHLQSDEIQSPGLFINKFFYKKPLKKWLKQWNITLDFGLCNESICYGYDIKYIVDFKLYNGLLEACYLIYTRHFTSDPNAPGL